MDENAIRQWLIDCFGPIQGEMAWNQLSNMPEAVRDQLMSQDPSTLPKPEEVKSMMQAFTAGGLNTMGDMQQAVEQGPINIKLAKSLALQQANGAGSDSSVNAETGEIARRAISEANLWLDTACEFNPAQGETQLLTRAGWVEDTIDAWAQFASPVAESMNDALASILSQRFGDGEIQTEISGVFAGPIEIPIPDEMKNPAKLMRFVGNTSFAMQLGRAAGDLSHEVRGSFDQGIALLKNPAGGLIVQNVTEYAKSLDIDVNEVMGYLALQELAHARLFASVPWLMPRFEALLGKYARGITIDMDAMEEQIREAESIDPDSMASAAHIPHIEQLREMLRRERAIGGPAERTFESLMGMQLRPKRMREAAALWESIGAQEGPEARDAKWSHPDLLPQLPDEQSEDSSNEENGAASATTGTEQTTAQQDIPDSIDWDAELSKLLDEEEHKGDDADSTNDADGTDDAGDTNASGDPQSPEEA